jgi:hypothetical protein
MTKKTTPRGIRNHNPGNLRRSKDRWKGLATEQTDEEFLRFSEPRWGIRALARTLVTYQTRHGLRTIRALIDRWAPPHENDSGAYVRAVSRAVMCDADIPVDVLDVKTLAALTAAIIRHENGEQPYGKQVILAAVAEALRGEEV